MGHEYTQDGDPGDVVESARADAEAARKKTEANRKKRQKKVGLSAALSAHVSPYIETPGLVCKES